MNNDSVEDSQELTPIRRELTRNRYQLRSNPRRRNPPPTPRNNEDVSKAVIIGSGIASLMIIGSALAVNGRPMLGAMCAIFIVCIALFFTKR